MGVAAVMFIKPGHQLFPSGALVSSGYDKLILVWDYKLQEPCLTLIGSFLFPIQPTQLNSTQPNPTNSNQNFQKKSLNYSFRIDLSCCFV
jgi:hypothetical protein